MLRSFARRARRPRSSACLRNGNSAPESDAALMIAALRFCVPKKRAPRSGAKSYTCLPTRRRCVQYMSAYEGVGGLRLPRRCGRAQGGPIAYARRMKKARKRGAWPGCTASARLGVNERGLGSIRAPARPTGSTRLRVEASSRKSTSGNWRRKSPAEVGQSHTCHPEERPVERHACTPALPSHRPYLVAQRQQRAGIKEKPRSARGKS
jgi:hypothetical protein